MGTDRCNVATYYVLIVLAEGAAVIPMIYPAFWYLMIGDFLHQSLILLYRFHENTMI